jgi:hypothetical protein
MSVSFNFSLLSTACHIFNQSLSYLCFLQGVPVESLGLKHTDTVLCPTPYIPLKTRRPSLVHNASPSRKSDDPEGWENMTFSQSPSRIPPPKSRVRSSSPPLDAAVGPTLKTGRSRTSVSPATRNKSSSQATNIAVWKKGPPQCNVSSEWEKGGQRNDEVKGSRGMEGEKPFNDLNDLCSEFHKLMGQLDCSSLDTSLVSHSRAPHMVGGAGGGRGGGGGGNIGDEVRMANMDGTGMNKVARKGTKGTSAGQTLKEEKVSADRGEGGIGSDATLIAAIKAMTRLQRDEQFHSEVGALQNKISAEIKRMNCEPKEESLCVSFSPEPYPSPAAITPLSARSSPGPGGASKSPNRGKGRHTAHMQAPHTRDLAATLPRPTHGLTPTRSISPSVRRNSGKITKSLDSSIVGDGPGLMQGTPPRIDTKYRNQGQNSTSSSTTKKVTSRRVGEDDDSSETSGSNAVQLGRRDVKADVSEGSGSGSGGSAEYLQSWGSTGSSVLVGRALNEREEEEEGDRVLAGTVNNPALEKQTGGVNGGKYRDESLLNDMNDGSDEDSRSGSGSSDSAQSSTSSSSSSSSSSASSSSSSTSPSEDYAPTRRGKAWGHGSGPGSEHGVVQQEHYSSSRREDGSEEKGDTEIDKRSEISDEEDGEGDRVGGSGGESESKMEYLSERPAPVSFIQQALEGGRGRVEESLSHSNQNDASKGVGRARAGTGPRDSAEGRRGRLTKESRHDSRERRSRNRPTGAKDGGSDSDSDSVIDSGSGSGSRSGSSSEYDEDDSVDSPLYFSDDSLGSPVRVTESDRKEADEEKKEDEEEKRWLERLEKERGDSSRQSVDKGGDRKAKRSAVDEEKERGKEKGNSSGREKGKGKDRRVDKDKERVKGRRKEKEQAREKQRSNKKNKENRKDKHHRKEEEEEEEGEEDMEAVKERGREDRADHIWALDYVERSMEADSKQNAMKEEDLVHVTKR